jgi:hypothetical protein
VSGVLRTRVQSQPDGQRQQRQVTPRLRRQARVRSGELLLALKLRVQNICAVSDVGGCDLCAVYNGCLFFLMWR